MRILFIFPHPDDESFGPAGAIHKHAREGHEVHLLTLTKGGATKVRHTLGLSVEAMGAVREQELLSVQPVLRLTSITVWDMVDSGLLEEDPRLIEKAISDFIATLKPAIVVTYPVQGISGFADHLVCHAVVKRAFLELRDNGATYLRRLAFFAMDEAIAGPDLQSRFKLNPSKPELIDCVVDLAPEDVAAFHKALDCYATYVTVIAASRVREAVGSQICFEFFQESYRPPAASLVQGLA